MKKLSIKPFICKECGAEVELVFLPGMADRTFREFNKRFSERKCTKCAYPERYM